MFYEAKFLGDNGRQAPRSGPIRGYTKISDAAKAFNFDFKGKVVLDIGSSTGGFTEYALEKGAKKVIAIEKGTNQMMKPLRFDSRIDLHEKTDIFNIKAEIVPSEGVRSAAARGLAREPRGDGSERRAPKKESISAIDVNMVGVVPSEGVRSAAARGLAREPRGRPPLGTRTTRRVDGSERRASKKESISAVDTRVFPDIILADVSFVSLTKILAHAKKYLADKHTEFLVMLKPQFEAKDYQLKNGIVKNETIRREIIKNFESWLKTNRFVIIKKKDNELKGKTGNTERFYYLMLEK